MDKTQLLYEALESKYLAQIAEAKATLSNLFYKLSWYWRTSTTP
jgi:hypothetical protein